MTESAFLCVCHEHGVPRDRLRAPPPRNVFKLDQLLPPIIILPFIFSSFKQNRSFHIWLDSISIATERRSGIPAQDVGVAVAERNPNEREKREGQRASPGAPACEG